ncbi:MAG: cache domain-containing protein [Desulfobulbaceae bacterium]|nr:cache domain-containing protein [Desulfobulbaceae bacterium]
MKAPGRIFIILLACISLFLAESAFGATPDEIKNVVDKVEKAAALVGSEGEAAYGKLTDPDGEFVNGSLYVFVFSLRAENKGVLTAHLKKGMVGKSLLSLKEPGTNRKFAQDFVAIAESAPGKGWTEYKWAKPNVREIAVKATYIMKVPGHELAIGAGIYDVTKAEAEAVM